MGFALSQGYDDASRLTIGVLERLWAIYLMSQDVPISGKYHNNAVGFRWRD